MLIVSTGTLYSLLSEPRQAERTLLTSDSV